MTQVGSGADVVSGLVNSPFGKAFVIANSRAGKGTRHPEVELARQAIDDGWTYLVAVGGDGTSHEVVNGMMGDGGPRNRDAVLGIVSAGSGSDFVRTFGLPDDASHGVEHLTGDGFVDIDLGRVTFTTEGGEATERFSNIA